MQWRQKQNRESSANLFSLTMRRSYSNTPRIHPRTFRSSSSITGLNHHGELRDKTCESNFNSRPPFVEIISRLTLIHDPSTVHAGKLKMCKMLRELIHSLFKGKERGNVVSIQFHHVLTRSVSSPLLHAIEVACLIFFSSSSFFLFIT